MQKCNQSEEEKPEKQQLIIELKHIGSSTHYKIACERKAIEAIQQDSDSRDFYNPVNGDVHFPEKRIYCYEFVKNVKLIGFPNHSTTLLVHYFEGAKGNTYFMWREDPYNPSHLSNYQNVIIVIQNTFPKYFSCVHKRIVRAMRENVMFDRISPAQFCLIYREITGDNSAPDTKQQAKSNLKTQTIMGNLDSSLCRDLQIYNARKSKYDKVW